MGDTIIKLTAAEFAEKVKALDVGEHFDFAMYELNSGEPKDLNDLHGWFGVQKARFFDNDMIIVGEYNGCGCVAFHADGYFIAEGVEELFQNMERDCVYTTGEKSPPPELTVSLTSSYCIDIRNGTRCGEDVFIPSKKVHNLFCEIEEYDALLDINNKTCDLNLFGSFNQKELRRMAKRVIDRRDNCDIISEAYWQIVEEVIQEFSAEKKQESQDN